MRAIKTCLGGNEEEGPYAHDAEGEKGVLLLCVCVCVCWSTVCVCATFKVVFIYFFNNAFIFEEKKSSAEESHKAMCAAQQQPWKRTHARTHTYSIMVFEPIDIMSVGVGNIKEVACPYCRCTKTS